MQEIENPFRVRRRWSLVVAGLGALGMGIMLIASARNPYLDIWWVGVALPSVFLLLFGGADALISSLSGSVAVRDIKHLVAGNYFIHWSYTEDEWRHFAETDWGRTKRNALLESAISMIAFTILGLIVGLLKGEGIRSFVVGLLVGLSGGLVIGPFMFGAGGYLQGKKAYRERMAATGEVYIGPKAVYTLGVYARLAGWGTKLGWVAIEQGDPKTLSLISRHPFLQSSSTTVRVPIPHGKDEEAKAVIARLSAKP